MCFNINKLCIKYCFFTYCISVRITGPLWSGLKCEIAQMTRHIQYIPPPLNWCKNLAKQNCANYFRIHSPLAAKDLHTHISKKPAPSRTDIVRMLYLHSKKTNYPFFLWRKKKKFKLPIFFYFNQLHSEKHRITFLYRHFLGDELWPM